MRSEPEHVRAGSLGPRGRASDRSSRRGEGGISLPLIVIKLPTPERRHGSKNDSVTFKNISV